MKIKDVQKPKIPKKHIGEIFEEGLNNIIYGKEKKYYDK